MNKPVIEVNHVSKRFRTLVKEPGFKGSLKSLFSPKYKEVSAVEDVSFQLKEGELIGFIGPNGAGKSTTIKMLTGILFPSSGKLNVLGYNPQTERIKLAYKIGVIFGQRQQLWHHLPPIDTFNLFSKIYELEEEAYQKRLNELILLFEIRPYLYTPVRKLSLGERMRCEFVASLLHRPKVLFLDEPTIGMDILAKKSVREFIRKLNQHEKTTVILTSHDLDDIEELCPRVVIINKGKLIYDGTMSRIKNQLKYKVLELYFDKKVQTLPKIQHTKIINQTPFNVKVEIDKTKVPIRKVLDVYLKKFKVVDIVIEDPPIEEIIERFYSK
ncbi:MAG: ATP-binding cassette domain-containing protein [Nanoarchaeota archaeon]